MTTGEPLVMRAAMKPIPSLRRGMPTVDFESGAATRAMYQRSDVTSVPGSQCGGGGGRRVELTAAFLEKFGGDSMGQVRAAYEHYAGELKQL